MDKKPTIKDVLVFLNEHMVTKTELAEQLTDLRSEVATKEDLRTPTIAVDNLAKNTLDYET